ncbi:hypothetical protein FBQ96_07025 [Nitrospirales bacterium NOB]|nr:hypothetical protein [Nitrospirales bacterium NOB]
MSDGVLIAGKRGSGKTLGALSMMRKYLVAGRTVATNLNIFIENLVPAYVTTRFYRVADHPTSQDLELLPLGNPFLYRDETGEVLMRDGFTEKKNGLLVLDEVSTFLNAREWQEGNRSKLLAWLVQSRKYGWDLLLITQHAEQIDRQVRTALIELQGTVRRMDRIQVPILSMIWKYFTNEPLHFPRIHFLALRYGFEVHAPIADRWFWRGTDDYKAYDTLQKISPITGQQGVSTMLSAYDIKGKRMNKWDLRRQMAAGGLVIGIMMGFAGGWFGGRYQLPETKPVTVDEVITVKGVAGGAGNMTVVLSDGRTATADAFKADNEGVRYRVGGKWYKGI